MGTQNSDTLLRDSDWSVIDGEPCKVLEFAPQASVQDGEAVLPNRKSPYASVTFVCNGASDKVTGVITHKLDFEHLWAAFKERGVRQDEEVIILWSKRHFKNYARIFSAFMPRLWVMICPKGAFELMTDQRWKPELNGEARWNATKPIVEWKPEVMK